MNIYDVANALTEQEKQAAELVEVAHTEIDAPNYWNMTFVEENHFYTVDILHSDNEVKNVSCQYCQSNDCIHIKAAYIEIVKKLDEPVFYNVEDELRQFSYDELVMMLVDIDQHPENLLQKYVQPQPYTVEEVYTMIDASLNQINGWIDEDTEDIALEGINRIAANAKWLYRKQPQLAVQHLLACLIRSYSIAERCDEDVHHFLSVGLDMQLEICLQAITDQQLAKAVTVDILNAIHGCAQYPLQPVPIDNLFYSAIHLSRVSKMGEEIKAVIERYRETLIEASRYADYIFDLFFYTATKEERILYYRRTDLSPAILPKLIGKAIEHQDSAEGIALCERLQPFSGNPRTKAMIDYFMKQLHTQLQN